MEPAEKIPHRSPATDAVRRPPVPAGVTSPGMSALQRLQRYAGNHAAEQLLTAGGDGRLHRCGPVPCNCTPEERTAKEGLANARYEGLPVSHPAEPAEREADEVTDQVMRKRDADPPVHIGPASHGPLHRHARDASGAPLAAGGEAAPQAAAPQAGPEGGLAAGIAQQVRGGGQALGGGLRQFMESRFGRDLSPVRVHTDAAAGRLARQADADAFTVGRHVFFAPGRYRPDDHAGRRLLAHELTHVVQQSAAGPAPAAVQRQARPGSAPPAAPAPVPAEKFSDTLESAYRRLGDHRRAAAIRSCRERGGGACNVVLTQAEVRKLYELAQRSGGDERKIRAGLPAAAPAALGTLQTLAPGLPPPTVPVPAPPPGAPGFPSWAPPPPVVTPPAAPAVGAGAGAEVAVGEVAGTEAVGGTAISVGAVGAVAVAALVVVCVVAFVEAWQFSTFQHELEAKGFIVLDDALQVCIHGCHAPQQPIRPFPDFDLPFRPLPELPFPRRPFPPWPDIETGRPRPPREDPEREEPEERRRKERRRRKETGPDIDIGPPDEKRRERDPCDTSPFHPCDGVMTFNEASEIVKGLPGFKDAKTSGREPVRDGACWVDGVPRSREQALAVGATHQTWNLPNGDKLATIKCCPCCMRGGTGAVLQHCTIN
jgi:hypothetical protein